MSSISGLVRRGLPPLHSTADINQQNRKGQTLLHLAVRKGDTAFAEFLLLRGASASVQNNEGETALQLAENSNPEIASLIHTRRSLAFCAYETNHLFDRFRIVFTNGVKKWSDADILFVGERHDRWELTRGFVSNFAPAEKLLVGVEGYPSMQLLDQKFAPYFFDEANIQNREAEFFGCDVERHLLPQANDYWETKNLKSREKEIIKEIDKIHFRVNKIYDHIATSKEIDDGLFSYSKKKLQELARRQKRLGKLCRQFVQNVDVDSLLEYFNFVKNKNSLVTRILKNCYDLKKLYPDCWDTPINKKELDTLTNVLRQTKDRLQQLHAPIEDLQKSLSKGRITEEQIRETFAPRTEAITSTVRFVGQFMRQKEMPARAVFVTGAHHLFIPEEREGMREFCLDTFYDELRNHKVAVVTQNL